MRKLLAGLVLAFVAACGGDGGSGPNTEHVGTYTLQTINGAALPFLLQSGTTRIEVTGGRVSLNADGTFSDITDLRVTQGTTVATTQEGTLGAYQRSGNNITLVPASGGSYSMAYSGNTLTQVESGATLVYRR